MLGGYVFWLCIANLSNALLITNCLISACLILWVIGRGINIPISHWRPYDKRVPMYLWWVMNFINEVLALVSMQSQLASHCYMGINKVLPNIQLGEVVSNGLANMSMS